MPLTMPELAAVEGVAAVKAERYGQEFLDITAKFAFNLPGNEASVELVEVLSECHRLMHVLR